MALTDYLPMSRAKAVALVREATDDAVHRGYEDGYQRHAIEMQWRGQQDWVDIFTKSGSVVKPEDREKAIQRSRANFLLNPLIVRAAQVYFNFVFGRGISRPKLADDWVEMLREETGEQDPQIVDRLERMVGTFWHDPAAQYYLTGYRAQQDRYSQLLSDGEVPIVLFRKGDNYSCGVLDTLEITDVLQHPSMPGLPLAWRRDYRDATGTHAEWYPAIESVDFSDNLREALGVSSVRRFGVGARLRDKGTDGSDISLVMVRLNRHEPLGLRGMPPFFSGLSWSAAVQELTQNLRTYLRALATWAWKEKFQGTAADIAAAKTAHASKLDNTNPRPTVGAIRMEGQGRELDPITIGTGGANSFEVAIDECLKMVYAATGLPAHYYGDVEQGNLATATAMELPVRKLFEAEQQFWVSVYDSLIQAMAKLAGIEVVTERLIEVDFPTIVESDAPALMGGLAQAVGTGYISAEDACRTAATALGADDIEDWVKRLETEALQNSETPTELNAAIEADPVRMAPVVLRWARKVRETIKAREVANHA